jgi:hypothetical protein
MGITDCFTVRRTTSGIQREQFRRLSSLPSLQISYIWGFGGRLTAWLAAHGCC